MHASLISPWEFISKNEVNLMLPITYPCPICKTECADPKQLQEHRIRNHRNALNEIKF